MPPLAFFSVPLVVAMTEDYSLDDWPPEAERSVTVRHAHAYGLVTINYNVLEEGLRLLFTEYMPTVKETSNALSYMLNNRERVDAIRELVAAEKEGETKKLVLFALKCFDICTENRKILTHAIFDQVDRTTETITVMKIASGGKKSPLLFELSLPELRRVADDMGALSEFVFDLIVYVKRRATRRTTERLPKDYPPPALPQKPAQPRKLSPRPHPKVT